MSSSSLPAPNVEPIRCSGTNGSQWDTHTSTCAYEKESIVCGTHPLMKDPMQPHGSISFALGVICTAKATKTSSTPFKDVFTVRLGNVGACLLKNMSTSAFTFEDLVNTERGDVSTLLETKVKEVCDTTRACISVTNQVPFPDSEDQKDMDEYINTLGTQAQMNPYDSKRGLQNLLLKFPPRVEEVEISLQFHHKEDELGPPYILRVELGDSLIGLEEQGSEENNRVWLKRGNYGRPKIHPYTPKKDGHPIILCIYLGNIQANQKLYEFKQQADEAYRVQIQLAVSKHVARMSVMKKYMDVIWEMDNASVFTSKEPARKRKCHKADYDQQMDACAARVFGRPKSPTFDYE